MEKLGAQTEDEPGVDLTSSARRGAGFPWGDA